MMAKTELVILRHLLNDEDFARRTLPYLKSEYFHDRLEKTVYQEIDKFINKYNNLPTKEALTLEMDSRDDLSDEEFSSSSSLISSLDGEDVDKQWLTDTTEKWCQEKAIYNAIMNSISILDGNDKKNDKGAIPELLSDALSVSFDPNIGHDFLDDADSRYDFYHKVEERIPFDL